jgi:carotenoid cleavage dioxygenase-like enzyme
VIRRDDFEAPFSSMVHDFLVTRRHALFPILPLTGDLQRAMRGGPAYAWEPDKGAHVGVMARDAGVETMRWFTTDACYVFHPMNAWEEGDTIFADVMEYPIAPLFPNADGSMPERASARLVRWTFDLAGASDTIKREPLDDLPGEFPRFDERRAGSSYRQGWFAGRASGREDRAFDCIAHVDLKTGKRTTYGFAPGDAPGEPVFVPRSADAPGGRRGLPRRGRPQRFCRLRRRRDRGGADRGRKIAATGSVRLPWKLAAGIKQVGRRRRFRFGTGLTAWQRSAICSFMFCSHGSKA